MDRFGLIGHPIGHSLSPKLFSAAYGGKYPYDLIETPDFEEAMKTFLEGPYRAVNVTSPFKKLAAGRTDILSEEVRRIGAANILLKTEEGIKAFNSDYRGLLSLIPQGYESIAVVGTGGAGRAALAAAEDLGMRVSAYHHDELADGLKADIVIYTLPTKVEGAGKIECNVLIEANYKDPCMKGRHGYIGGYDWLVAQARTGFPLMTGEPSGI